MSAQRICPICFSLYGGSRINKEWPMCPDCESEAMEIEVEPLDVFLSRHRLKDLADILQRWKRATGFLESYKADKQRRIERVIRLKRGAAKTGKLRAGKRAGK